MENKLSPEKANDAKHSKTKLALFYCFLSYDTRPRNKTGLFYNTAEPKWDRKLTKFTNENNSSHQCTTVSAKAARNQMVPPCVK